MSDTTNGDDGKGRGRGPGGKRGTGGGDRERGDRPKPREGGKPFTPKSRGMFSHGGARDDKGEGAKPRSFGRLQHDAPKGDRTERSGGERRPVRDDRPKRAPRDDRAPRAETESAVGEMRIAKRLARAGIASRRDAEGMIADGRVKLNGKVLDTPAVVVTASDRIEIDNAPLPAIERTRLWLFHKAAGTVTTNRDPEGRPTIFDRLPSDMPRVLTVGRLDINTEGLLLLTNDGGLARILELPATGWLRRYRVRAHGAITQARLDELRQGIAIEGVFYGAIEATMDREQGSNVWLTLGLREGKNREVKKVLAHLGLEVNRLIRLSFGPFQLGDLKEGSVQEIKGRMLRDQLGERLIEESGADFDAPVAKPFSNRPVEAERTERPKKSDEWISASETAPNKKRVREAKREDALGRLDTRAGRPERSDRGDRKPYGERPGKRFEGPKKPYGDRDAAGGRDDAASPPKRPIDAPKRSANVWMAPGARPQGTKKAPGSQAGRPDRGPTRGERPSGPSAPRGGAGKPAGRPPRSGGDAPQRPGRPPRTPRKG